MRPARPSDAPAVAEVLRQAASTGLAMAAPHEVDEHKVAEDLADGIGLRIVAERGGEVVGFLKLEPGGYQSVARTARLQLAVRGDQQGRGIGAELLRAGIAWAEGGALDRIEVFVRETNTRALELYKRFGFLEEGRLKKRIRRPSGERIDDVVLGRDCERALP